MDEDVRAKLRAIEHRYSTTDYLVAADGATKEWVESLQNWDILFLINEIKRLDAKLTKVISCL